MFDRGAHAQTLPAACAAGGFIGIGATKDMIKGMPLFAYATDTTKRDAFATPPASQGSERYVAMPAGSSLSYSCLTTA